MLNWLVVAAVLGMALVGCAVEKQAEPVPLPRTTTSESAADQAAVRQAFDAYRAALTAKDGKTAASLLTAESIEYYANLKKLALTAPESYLRRARMSDQLAVIDLRVSVPAENLRRWSAAQLAGDAVNRGETQSTVVARLSAGTIEVAGDTGTVQVKLDGKAFEYKLTFYREDGQWKFRLIPILEATEGALRRRVQEDQVTETDLVDEVVAQTVPPEKIRVGWLPAA
jgi:hypothetical protein